MLILSKYKDYYDFLTSKYGIDKHIVLDRNSKHSPKVRQSIYSPYSSNKNKLNTGKIYFCDYEIDYVVFDNKQYYYEDEIEKLLTGGENSNSKFIKNKWGYRPRWYSNDFYNINGEEVLRKRKLLSKLESPNRKLNCPILHTKNHYKYPMLSQFQFHKIFTADEAYQTIYQWLVSQKEVDMIEIEDKYKIDQHGFDKNSFRHPVK